MTCAFKTLYSHGDSAFTANPQLSAGGVWNSSGGGGWLCLAISNMKWLLCDYIWSKAIFRNIKLTELREKS